MVEPRVELARGSGSASASPARSRSPHTELEIGATALEMGARRFRVVASGMLDLRERLEASQKQIGHDKGWFSDLNIEIKELKRKLMVAEARRVA